MHTKSFNWRRHSLLALRGLHFVGLAVFLGSIIANIAINQSIVADGLPMLANGRTLISLTSRHLVLQGLALMAATGIAMAGLRYGVRWPVWLYAKIACAALIVAISFIFLFPSIDEATRWAGVSAEQNQRVPEFSEWLAREARFGMLNVLLFVSAGALALWRPSFKRASGPRSAE